MVADRAPAPGAGTRTRNRAHRGRHRGQSLHDYAHPPYARPHPLSPADRGGTCGAQRRWCSIVGDMDGLTDYHVMRRALMVLIVTCCCILPVTAQDQADDADQAAQLEQLRERLQEARERLALTDQQRDQVRPILAAGLEAQREVLAEHGIDLLAPAEERPRLNLRQLRALGADLDAVRAETLAALAEVLTAEQLETYRELQDERRQELRDRLRERRAAG